MVRNWHSDDGARFDKNKPPLSNICLSSDKVHPPAESAGKDKIEQMVRLIQ